MRMRRIFIKIPRVEIRLQGQELSDILQITSQMLKQPACCAVARGSFSEFPARRRSPQEQSSLLVQLPRFSLCEDCSSLTVHPFTSSVPVSQSLHSRYACTISTYQGKSVLSTRTLKPCFIIASTLYIRLTTPITLSHETNPHSVPPVPDVYHPPF